MTKAEHQGNAAIITGLVLIVVLSVLYCAVWLAPQVDLPFIPQTTQSSTRLSLFILVVGTLVGYMLFSTLLYMSLGDYFQRQKVSPLVFPLLLGNLCLILVTTIQIAGAYDVITHETRRWPALLEPEVRVMLNLFLFGVFTGFGWLLWLILRGRGKSTKAIGIVYGSLLLLAVVFGVLVIS